MKRLEVEDENGERTIYEVVSRSARTGRLFGDLNKLFALWDKQRGGSFAPAWRTFDLRHAPMLLIPWIAVVTVTPDPLDFVYCFWGTERTRLQGKDYTGLSVCDFRPEAIAQKAFGEYAEVLETGEPRYLTTYGLTDQKTKPFTYHFLRLPFSDDGEAVTHILGVGVYDRVASRHAAEFYGRAKLNLAPPD